MRERHDPRRRWRSPSDGARRRGGVIGAIVLALTAVLGPAGTFAQSREDYQQLVDAGTRLLAQRLGRDLPSRPRVVVNDRERKANGRSAPAYAVPQAVGDTDVAGGCDIHVNPSITSERRDDRAYIVLHEVVHCFQAAFQGMAGFETCKGWLCEGSAVWAGKRAAEALGYDIASPRSGSWRTYLTKPDIPLFAREYDAVGFFGHLEQSGVDPWAVLAPMWMADSDEAAYAMAAEKSPTFADAWASSFLRSETLGAAWDADGPGIPDRSVHATAETLTPGTGIPKVVSVDPYANRLMKLDLRLPLFTLTTQGHVRLADELGLDLTAPTGTYCVGETRACECPAGLGSIGVPTLEIGETAYLALTGAADGASAIVSASDAADLCVPTECPVTEAEASDILDLPIADHDVATEDGHLPALTWIGAPGDEPTVYGHRCTYGVEGFGLVEFVFATGAETTHWRASGSGPEREWDLPGSIVGTWGLMSDGAVVTELNGWPGPAHAVYTQEVAPTDVGDGACVSSRWLQLAVDVGDPIAWVTIQTDDCSVFEDYPPERLTTIAQSLMRPLLRYLGVAAPSP